jgi:hypothetical protein
MLAADVGTRDDMVPVMDRSTDHTVPSADPFPFADPIRADDPFRVDHTMLTTVGTSGASPQVDTRIREATRILMASGIPESQLNPQDLALIIQHESSGDPLAVNNWDYNAQAGIPSKGLMQTIEPTFREYALPAMAISLTRSTTLSLAHATP